MSPTRTALHTVGDVARLLNLPIHRVEYILRSRPQIQPVGRVGIARVYDESAVELVRQAITDISRRQLVASARTHGAVV